MQMEFEWGEPIATDGKRPEWLRDGESIFCLNRADDWVGPRTAMSGNEHIWAWMREFKLRADHPYYVAKSKGFTYWPGGENAPVDWDGGDVLLKNGRNGSALGIGRWFHGSRTKGYEKPTADDAIIGYKRKVGPSTNDLFNGGHLPQSRCVNNGVATAWALARVRELSNADSNAPQTAAQRLNALTMAFARYIEEHEQPPVDPDVLAVRKIATELANGRHDKDAIEDGECDDSPQFIAALAAYHASLLK